MLSQLLKIVMREYWGLLLFRGTLPAAIGHYLVLGDTVPHGRGVGEGVGDVRGLGRGLEGLRETGFGSHQVVFD